MNSDQTDVQKYIPNGTKLFHTMAYTQNKVQIAINSLDTDLCYSFLTFHKLNTSISTNNQIIS